MKKRVLFVCLGNSIRSQMAEAFARVYGSDTWEVASAGLMPATIISPLTCQVMEEKNVSLDGQFPKSFEEVKPEKFDLIVNMSGLELPPGYEDKEICWQIEDPIGQSERAYRRVRDQIESRVRSLLEDVQAGRR